jgi:cell division initiation protein
MEVSPKTLREVEFREKMRGYHPEDVDHFLEQVAAGIEVLQDRLRQAVERAQRAEAAASESGSTDDTLRKTLVLAQRTADLAVSEAREQAARILASAEQQAQAILTEAEERGRRTLEDTIAECKAELSRLESARGQAQQDVDSLQRWLDEHKTHLLAALSEAMAAVERAGVLWPAPSIRPFDTAGVSSASRPPLVPPVAVDPLIPPPPAPGPDPSAGPDTVVWGPPGENHVDVREGSADPGPTSGSHFEASGLGDDPGQQALDDFFDENDDFGEDRRSGSRLRRRR